MIESLPQRLKPSSIRFSSGTTEPVPFVQINFSAACLVPLPFPLRIARNRLPNKKDTHFNRRCFLALCVGFVSGHDFSRAAKNERDRASAPEVRSFGAVSK